MRSGSGRPLQLAGVDIDPVIFPPIPVSRSCPFPPARTKSIVLGPVPLKGAYRDERPIEMPSDPRAKTRVRIAFLCLFVFMIVFAVGAYYVADLSKLQESIAARESQAALQGVTDAAKLDQALRQHPSNKLLQLTAMATRAADQTGAETEKWSKKAGPRP